MTVTENYMLQQMQQMAASMTALPQTAETAPVQNQEKEELRPEDMTANPNAVILDLFRPEIAPAAEEAAIPAPVEALPQETVEETAMNLDGQMPTLDTSVETTVEMETPTGEEQGDFRQAMQEPAETAEVQSQSTEQTVQQPEAADPEQSAERPESQDGEVRAETAETSRKDGEEIQGEAAEPEQSVFRETQSTPVKVGERYETVDTQKPDMEAKLADTIRQAAQTGTELCRWCFTRPTAGRRDCSSSIWTACTRPCRATARARRSTWRSSAIRTASSSTSSRRTPTDGASSSASGSRRSGRTIRPTARTSSKSCVWACSAQKKPFDCFTARKE